MLSRPVFEEEHEMYRAQVRRFIEKEVVPHHAQWEKDGVVSREVWLAAGEAGLLCPTLSEEYGGAGADFRYSAVVVEELARAGTTGPAFYLHSDIVVPYIETYGSPELKAEWLPRMAKGEVIGAIAMSEPAAGSDLQGIKTRAEPDGNHYVINGQKVFITNGQLADLVIVVTKTDKEAGAKGTSLILVDREREGFTRGRNLEKVGYKAQDTSELFFEDVRVPRTNLLGEDEGQGFFQLMEQLPQERMLVALRCVRSAEEAIDQTVAYTSQRHAFGKPIAAFQNTRFKMAENKTKAVVARAFLDRCLELHLDGELDTTLASMAKLHCTELLSEVLDDCVQLHGGYGYMWEYPIARAWADARMGRIAGGSSEIMKEIIGRSLYGR